MKNNSILYQTALAALLMGVLPINIYAQKGDITFTKNTGKGTITSIGSKKAETYDVAVLLKGKDLKGKTVKSITIPFKSKDNLSNLKVWLSNKLALATENGKKVNSPDILSQEVPFDKDTVTITLATPYTIDADSIYIGYTFDSKAKDNDSKTPILISTEAATNAFYIHSSRTYRSWVDNSAKGTSTISAILGNADGDLATVGTIGHLVNGKGKATEATVDIVNYGYNGVKSIDYSYEIGTKKGNSHLDLSEAIPAIYGAAGQATITLPALENKGNYPISIIVNKVNGTDNAAALATTGDIDIYNVLPKHRAVLEEYTGTWCGYCPRGLVGLEVMKRLYPDDFIGLSYHNGDAMTVMSTDQFPADISGFPAAWLDRSYEADAYYGWNSNSFGIDKAWKYASDQFAPVAVSTTAKLAKDGNKVNATAKFTFVKDIADANYHVEFVLVSDSLTGNTSSWKQSNYYAKGKYGTTETFPEPEFKQFYEGESTVEGLYFPDVVLATTRLNGNDVALPKQIKEDEELEASCEFDLSEAVNTSGESLVQKKECLRVAALLIDEKGAIVNAAQSKVDVSGVATGITQIENNLDNTNANATFNLVGQRVSKDAKGLIIRKDVKGHAYKFVNK